MLATMDSQQLSEWQAYERFNGPLDDTWDKEILAQVHELIQQLIIITVSVNSDKKVREKVQPPLRPWAAFEDEKSKKPKKSKEETVAELNEAIQRKNR